MDDEIVWMGESLAVVWGWVTIEQEVYREGRKRLCRVEMSYEYGETVGTRTLVSAGEVITPEGFRSYVESYIRSHAAEIWRLRGDD